MEGDSQGWRRSTYSSQAGSWGEVHVGSKGTSFVKASQSQQACPPFQEIIVIHTDCLKAKLKALL